MAVCSVCLREVDDFDEDVVDGDYGEPRPVITCLECLNEEEEEEELDEDNEELTIWEERGCSNFEEYRRFVMGK